MSSPKQPESKDAIVAMRLPVALRDRLRVEAAAHQRSMSGQVRWLIERSFTHADNGNPDPGADTAERQAAA